ncbi:antibiotic biosynthesis monooxygenase [Aeromicrobium sp. A1-2]|uniref:putative quinol monooxygenase n=1 Tax=Aeromicrobium sp. A1-2 TaxID=2107713 RepID=UPI000E4B6954|nr:antibiotic biosynthesis monooxygenase [Aeromicrobium sp. A1-2]AXT86677.1 antibiotic biosynthesis monooxygenase [Aeromicrobium sp. A1-2]
MIIIAGHIRVAAAERNRYLSAVEGVAAQARATTGCHDFIQSADPIEPERINIYERWESDEDLISFRTSGNDENEPPSLPDVLGAEVSKYRISSVESP